MRLRMTSIVWMGTALGAACSGSEAGQPQGGDDADALAADADAATDADMEAVADATAATDSALADSALTDSAPHDIYHPDTAGAQDAEPEVVVVPVVCDDGVDPSDPRCHDTDLDGVPDHDDLWPDDPERPGTVAESTVYANTWAELYRLGVKTHPIELQCAFEFPDDGGTHGMTDIAVDRWGVLYGITFDRLYVIHPRTCECTWLANLDGAWNGLTFLPRGTLDPDDDVLVGLTVGGAWFRLDIADGVAVSTLLGSLGEGRGSSGDAFSVVELGTYAVADHGEGTVDELAVIDPTTGAIASVIGPIGHYTAIYGLAGWYEMAFAFDEDGDVLSIDTDTGAVDLIGHKPGVYWWGAGVKARIGPSGL
ncbi:MAG: hypothetical protein U1F43_02225 [Myxococcota bacterium]